MWNNFSKKLLTMPIDVVVADDAALDLLDGLNRSVETPLVYYTSGYLKFLLEVAQGAVLRNLVAMDNGCPVGVLPLLEQRHGEHAVLNSLPFYGSHGGPLVEGGATDVDLVTVALLQAAMSIASHSGALSLTIIENPLQPISEGAIATVGLDLIDDRIGQFTRLPQNIAGLEDLLSIFHQKTRNAVRKGYLANQVVRQVSDIASLRWLQQVHADAISKMGGFAKGMPVFEKLVEYLPLGQASRLYIGYVNGEPVSGLLVLLHGRTVEYFTPVATEAFKNEQVLSALIAEVMQNLVAEGYQLWNWGGTWRSQEGVYRFKSRFGAKDYPYRYVGKIFDETKLRQIKSDDPSAFRYFYLFRY